MHVGHYISGAAHLSFLLWLVMGDVFTSKPEEISITSVSIISEEQFANQLAKDSNPQVSDEIDILNQIEPDELTNNPSISKIDSEVPAVSPKVPNTPKLEQDKLEIPDQMQSVSPELSNEPDQPVLNKDDPSLEPSLEASETPSPVIADRVASVPVMPENADAFNRHVRAFIRSHAYPQS